MTSQEIVARAYEVFQDDVAAIPPLTLRGGNAVDGYALPEPFDPVQDAETDRYLEGFSYWGLIYLDAQSWRHYLPRLIDYAFTHPDDPAMAIEALVRSLRPPDRYPPRLATLTAPQEAVVTAFLERLAFDDAFAGARDDAQHALEEWWLANPRNRPTAAETAARRAAPMSYKHVERSRFHLTLPETLVSSGERDIPQESRRVEVWGGYLCGDAHTIVAVNVMPIAVRSLDDSTRARMSLFSRPDPRGVRSIAVAGARRAERIDGQTQNGSPAEPQDLTLVFAEAGPELVMLSIRTWPRDDVRREAERVVASLAVVNTDEPR